MTHRKAHSYSTMKILYDAEHPANQPRLIPEKKTPWLGLRWCKTCHKNSTLTEELEKTCYTTMAALDDMDERVAGHNCADMINTRSPSACASDRRQWTAPLCCCRTDIKSTNYTFKADGGGVVAPEAGGERGTQSVMQLRAAEMSAQLPDSVFLLKTDSSKCGLFISRRHRHGCSLLQQPQAAMPNLLNSI